MSKHILLLVLLNHAPTHSDSLPPTATNFHLLPSTPIHSHPLPLISILSHLLSPTPIHSQTFPFTPTHWHPFPLIFSHSHPLPFTFSPLLRILKPLTPMHSLSHPFPAHIQILLPNLTHHVPFQPMFSRCILRAYINFNVNLFFLLFSILFRKQLITLGLTTTFVYFKKLFVH